MACIGHITRTMKMIEWPIWNHSPLVIKVIDSREAMHEIHGHGIIEILEKDVL